MLHTLTSIATRSLRWLRRLPYRRGYGIHSPFAFTLVTDVIYNRWPYYAYDALRAAHRQELGGWSEKDARLLFRLANHQEAQRMLVADAAAGLRSYLSAARPSAMCEVVEGRELVASGDGKKLCLWSLLQDYDLLLLDGAWERWLSLAETTEVLSAGCSALVVVREPFASPQRRALWTSMCASSRITLSFDLHRLGLLYVRPKLNKQNYVINYF